MANNRLTAQDFDNADQQSPMYQQSVHSPSSSGSALQNVSSSPGIQSVLGAGDALRNTIASAANILPGVNISPVKTGSGTAYDIGNIAGNLGAFIGGGEGLDAARAASESAPVIGKFAQQLGNDGIYGVLRRTLGNAIYGELSTNQDREKNAGMGVALSLASDATPGIVEKTANALNYFMPQRYAQDIIQSLKSGVQSSNPEVSDPMGDTAKSVISDIRNSYLNQRKISSGLYDPVFNSVGNSRIYAPITNPVKGDQAYKISTSPNVGESVDINYPSANSELVPGRIPEYSVAANTAKIPGGKQTSQQIFSNMQGAYPQLSQDITDSYTNKLKELHNNFISDPTFKNAHALQSEIGVQKRTLGKNLAPTIEISNQIHSLDDAQNALRSDMTDFLNKNGNPISFDESISGAPRTDIAKQYQDATNNFRENVVPYQENPKLSPFALGEKTNFQPSTLAARFAAPDEDVSKILSHLPANTMDKILYTKLGQTVPNKSAQSLLNSYENLNQQGLGPYVSQSLSGKIGELNSRIKARNGLNTLATTLAGAGIGHYGGSAPAGAILGLGAAHVATPFMNYATKRLGIDDMSQAISHILNKTYSPATKVILSNYLNNSGVQNNGS